ncbi:pimeloyl-ACP methyl ester carboxylesterase [Rhodoligotrophos appendicifer]|uniref:alpha/beta fold hydrolase n=1 Tax=Rhodoligotrophos appendicifer TaxID=987056 RepID=UPI0014792523|nr:alpha/beta hydrolase [Rhodoligotrophos appendicifer]
MDIEASGDVRRIGGYDTFLTEEGQGSPVMLLHGSSIAVDGRLTWFRTTPVLAERHRVIVYDQPGFGRSEIPRDRQYLDRLARSVHAQHVLEALDLSKVTLVGHSEGAFIATKLALDNPDRVSKLIIVTSGGTSPRLGGDMDADWQAASAIAYDYKGRSVDEETFVRSEGHLRHSDDPEFETILRHNFRQAVQSGNVDCFLSLASQRSEYGDYTSVQEKHILPFLPQLKIPTLLVWAGADATVPVARGLALAHLIPTAEMHVFPRSGHWVMHEASAGFNRLLESWI